MKKYIILSTDNLVILEQKINDKIDKGYIPIGGVSIAPEKYTTLNHVYVQAMILKGIA